MRMKRMQAKVQTNEILIHVKFSIFEYSIDIGFVYFKFVICLPKMDDVMRFYDLKQN